MYNVHLIFSCDKIEKNEMSWACSANGEGEVYTGFWVGKLEGKRSLGRPRRSLENNIKTDLQGGEFGVHGLDRACSG